MIKNDQKLLKTIKNDLKQQKMTQNDSRQPKMTINDAKKLSVTDGPTDGLTDGPTDGAGCRVACTRLKIRSWRHSEENSKLLNFAHGYQVAEIILNCIIKKNVETKITTRKKDDICSFSN